MVKIAVIGMGNIGHAFLEVLDSKRDFLKQNCNFEFSVVGIADLKLGLLENPEGLDLSQLLKEYTFKGHLNDIATPMKKEDSIPFIENSLADILVEITPTNIKTAQPALTHVKTALENGIHVVTCNKGPAALEYQILKQLADKNNVQFRIEGTVMVGTPVINLTQQNLAGNKIHSIHGILNGTTNYMLSLMEKGKTYAQALEKAQKLGYAETDPTADVEGHDALAKVAILANVLLNANLKIEDIACEGITKMTPEKIQGALKEGQRWKLLGEIVNTDDGVIAKVEPQKVSLAHPLAQVMGPTNAVTIDTDLMGEITVVGAGAGRSEAAFALLNDIIQIHRGAY